MAKVLISTTTFGKYDRAPLSMLESEGLEIVLNPYGRKLAKEETADLLKGVEYMIAGTEKLDREALEKSKGLKIISRCGVGMDNVDLAAAAELGIKVFNTPYGPTLAVAELTVGLMLDLMRRFTEMDRELRRGNWKKRMGNLLRGKNVGIVGFGRIGQKVAELLLPFGVAIGYSDIIEQQVSIECARMAMPELFRWADIITIHSSAGKEVLSIGSAELGTMKKGSWLVNTSRGELVDEEALFEALSSGQLAGAAIDVFAKEPYEGKLRELGNVILTPHIASYAMEARVDMEMQSVQNLLKGMETL